MIDDAIQLITGTDNTLVVGLFKAMLTTIALPLVLFLIKSWYSETIERRSRRRELYAEALTACMEYKEFPYVIYRRNGKQLHEERTRISEALRDVQKKIAYHQAWLKTESGDIATAYDNLVQTLRLIAGEEMKSRWKSAPIKRDSEMTVAPKFEWSKIEAKEQEYLITVRRHLAPVWKRPFVK